jgi:hypothetical protein
LLAELLLPEEVGAPPIPLPDEVVLGAPPVPLLDEVDPLAVVLDFPCVGLVLLQEAERSPQRSRERMWTLRMAATVALP